MIHKAFLISLIVLSLANISANSQCACIGGASVGGITPINGAGNIGLLKKGNIRSTLFYSYSAGSNYYSKDIKTDTGSIKNFETSFLGLNIGYGINEEYTGEIELFAYPNKTQDYYEYKLSGSGLSHIALHLKYNIWDKRSKEIEWTLGIGGKMPLQTGNTNLPQNIQASSGAYGFIFQSFFHKGFKNESLHFILVNRIENNFENENEYKYGLSFINSFFISKSIIDNLTGIFEFRGETRTRDKKYGSEIKDSGSNTLIISPQLTYNIKNFNFSIMYDFPAYKYYYGKQLTKDYSFGASLTWQSNLFN